MKKMSKQEMVDAIHTRLDKAVPKEVIASSLSVIYDYIFQTIVERGDVIVPGFGTLQRSEVKGSAKGNIVTGKMHVIDDFSIIRFECHSAFKKMIRESNKLLKEAREIEQHVHKH